MEMKGMMMMMMMGEVMPCMMMVLMEACTIGLTIMASTLLSKGMSPFVFVLYTNALSSILLLPFNTFIIRRHKNEELFPLFISLGFVGITMAQNLAYLGLNDSSPIVACGMGLLIPSLSFILTIICRMTNIDWKSSSTRSKIAGTLISIIGAILLTLYKGPPIKYSPSHLEMVAPRLFVFSSKNGHWVLGCAFFAAASLAVAIWSIIQVKTLEKCPEVMSVTSCYSLIGTVQCALLTMMIERNPSSWRLNFDMGLLVIVATAIFGSLIRSHVHMWCIRIKGHFYVTMFKPLGIPIASTCGCLFFAESFHYGSIMGAAVIGIGYYTIMWGQMREDETRRGDMNLLEEKGPLLQGEEQV